MRRFVLTITFMSLAVGSIRGEIGERRGYLGALVAQLVIEQNVDPSRFEYSNMGELEDAITEAEKLLQE